jgi:hypothetical protein
MTVRTPHAVKEDRHWLSPPDWWKRFRPLRWLAILTIIGGLGSGLWGAKEIALAPRDHPETALYTAVARDTLVLGGVFRSYSSVETVTAQLGKDGATWTTISNHRPHSDRYPPRKRDTIKVEEYRHLGQTGKLTLEFFNDRLFEMYFEPASPGAYSRVLYPSESRLKKNRLGKTEVTDGHLRMATNVDLADSKVGVSLRTKPFAIWQDLRLVRQNLQWDTEFGAIPAPREG